MKKDIILAGVGGQGILSIATILGAAATKAGLFLKQAEVHGMSQRGGDVQSHLRLSTEPIYSDLIPNGQADIIIAMEPMEALRYVPSLSANGIVITSSAPFVNIPNYPETASLMQALKSLPKVVMMDIETKCKEEKMPKSANVMLLGMAARHLEILTPEQLKTAVTTVFAAKGTNIVETNLRAFEIGSAALE